MPAARFGSTAGRLVALAVLFGAVGCRRPADDGSGTPPGSLPPPAREEAEQNLRTQSDQISRAFVECDHERLADFTHPTLVERMGGRARFTARLREIEAEVAAGGVRFDGTELSPPSGLVESSGKLYAITRYELRLTGPGGARGRQPAYFIAESTDGGRNWKFIDGAGLGSNPKLLKQIMPDFPADLPLPDKQPARWDTD